MSDQSSSGVDVEEIKADIEIHEAALDGTEHLGNETWWSTSHAMTMSASVLAFGIVVILTIAYLIQRGRRPDELLRIFGTSLIIIMAIFLVVAGYSDEQMSPVMGLLGTIAGYLLGKGAREQEVEDESRSGGAKPGK